MSENVCNDLSLLKRVVREYPVDMLEELYDSCYEECEWSKVHLDENGYVLVPAYVPVPIGYEPLSSNPSECQTLYYRECYGENTVRACFLDMFFNYE
jgi:hypothetical protein